MTLRDRGGLALVCVAAALSIRCAASMSTGGGGDFGATQGGVQDMSFARELVANGQVPPAAAFVVEGMFSEHDLPLAGQSCSTLLCLRGALGVAPTLDGESSGWVQVGMSSTINPETYQRPNLALVAAVDVSGSMGWGYSGEQTEYPHPGAISRKLLHAIAEQLGPNDTFAIVAYGSGVGYALNPVAGSEQQAISNAIDGLHEDGSTNMEAGLSAAFDVARKIDPKGGQRRVMLFTDAQPNVGATSATEFMAMTEKASSDGVGLTVFGLGLGLSQELMDAMSHLRGGNAFSFSKLDQVPKHMEENWPWFVSPIAYDLKVNLVPSEGFKVADSYGFPKADGAPGSSLDVSTVFLSKKRGALLIRLGMPAQGAAGMKVAGNLSYTTLENQPMQETMDLSYGGEPLDARGQYFQQASVGKTVALALLVAAMREGAEKYAADKAAALARVKLAKERFAADSAALNDPTFEPELKLANDLIALMEKGAPQGDLYGQR